MVRSPPTPTDYIAPFEVVIHNTSDDCWISFLGRVYDITAVVQKFEAQTCVRPLLVNAGKDVSHWFDERTGDIQHHVHPITGALVPFCPNGPVPDVWVNYPNTQWMPLEGKPWWKDEEICIYKGPLTKKVRPIRIVNTLTLTEVCLNVCCEDTIRDIARRYSIFCDNVESYTWRTIGICDEESVLKMDLTLEENGIPDQRDLFARLRMPVKPGYTPCITMHYNDDMARDEAEYDALYARKIK